MTAFLCLEYKHDRNKVNTYAKKKIRQNGNKNTFT
ncbi:Uncharacterised protein [Bergeyella zoohelcum]|uniref:Uncharacterized protein n=2 Tax=Bergeyella zoohelcum TaxID=1015 RepID=K1M5I9_9FLAO|nr:hypothetical protein HMPREF9699_00423 [Bergeyella zoohelcum ATCC 43767]SUV49389.1 Uncharacterised protein [Bergeyella zoohelcum]VDH03510.1 Uncharacterised protein [Bergeyella zoohelcum]